MPSSPTESQSNDVLKPKKSTKLFMLVALAILVVGCGVGFSAGYYSDRLFTKEVESHVGDAPAEAASPNNESETKNINEKHEETKVADGHDTPSEGHGTVDEGKSTEGHDTADGSSEHNSTSHIVLDPVITNIATPSDVWVRLETVFSVAHPISPDVIKEIHQDYMAFFRTLRLEDLEGGSPYNDLKSELLARANTRADDAVNAIYFKAFLFE